MTNKNSSTNFLVQGSILAFAGILVRVIGLIYRIPLNNILGNEGIGYYSTAYGIYSILLLLSSQSMPLAVSKLVSARLTKGEHKNAYKMFKGAMVYAIVVGLVLGMVAFFGADALAGFYEMPSSARALRVLAPTLVIVSIIGVFRGYFQGMGHMGPTAMSQILEQIVNAIVSVVAAYQLYIYGKSIEAASQQERITNASSYSAAGGTLGTCLGAFAAFLVLLIIYLQIRDKIKRRVRRDRRSGNESYGTITKMIILTITPVLFSTTIYQIGNLIDNAIYSNIMKNFFDMEESVRSSLWGVYSGKYQLLTTMPIAIASSLSLSMVPTIVESYTKRDRRMVRRKIDMAIRFTMIIAFPCGVGLSVLGGPINILLFPNAGYVELTSKMMLFGVLPVLAFSLSTISNAILQGIDRLNVPIINSGISLIIHLILLPILLIVFKLDIYSAAIGDFTFAIVICILNARAIKRYLRYRQEVKNTFIKPLISAGVMGIVSYVVYFAVNSLLMFAGLGRIISNDISVIIAILIAVIVYFGVLIKIKGVNEEQLLSFPKGTFIVRLCEKLHLL